MLIKLGEAVEISPESITPIEKLASDSDLNIENRMAKFAQELKVIAPQAKDFLYFTCVMMHAAEAACVNEDGSPKKLANGDNVVCDWEKVGDSVKWVCNDPGLMPYKNNNCFIPGTDILMADGSRKAIEDIVVGDEVITHKGRVRKVTETFVHENNSQIFHIKAKNHPKLSVTSEHPLFALSGNEVRKSSLRDARKIIKDLSWVKAEDIAPGDFLTSVSLNIKEESNLTPGQARMLGYFAAEGCFSKKYGKRQGVVFTFGITEKYFADKVAEIVEEEFPECSVKISELPSRSVIKVTITGHGIAEWFYDHVGEMSHEKKLSKEVVFGSDEVKRQFVLGWIEGDGCITDGNKLIGISTSPHLAWQIWMMARSMEMNVSIRKVSSCKRFIQIDKRYKEYPCRDHYRVEFYGGNAEKICKGSLKYDIVDRNEKPRPAEYFMDDHSLHRVREVEIEPYCGLVYNFEVEEDHSYIANGVAVHNSDIFPESELKTAYKNWVGRPLCLDHQSQSVDKIRGVIVDTVYDDKRKRVIALCALDKLNYADLAHKVKSGVANNVSMGTAVGRAVCTDCGAVARTERDFCQHMRGKSCYGEINLDLNPIELSLVVSGADPKAKVKHIIASDVAKAASLLTDYLQLKEAAKEVSTHDLESIKEDLESLTKKMTSLVRGSSSDENKDDEESDAVGPTHSKWSMEEDITPDPSATELNAPSRLPITSELQQAVLGAQTKLASLQENLNRLSNRNEEPTMTTKNAYYQGTEEPKPGQKQYPVDPLNEQARLMDKNLHGPAPFPNVGDVEGSYPGDEQTKKELQRLADEHERAMFREAALKKAKEQLQSKGYFQGTEEPKPGQKQYPVDPLNEKAREEDKHLQGPPPFPGVGDVDDIYPRDKKTKEMLARASLRARFEKVAQPDGRIDKGASRWIVLANEKPILAATVDQISKGNSTILYDTIATEKFGKGILQRIQSEGFEATASLLLKNAQPAPAAPPPAEAAPPAPADVPPAGDLEPPEDVGGEAGDPAEIIDDLDALLDEMKAKLDDLRGKVSGPVAEDAEGLEGIPAAGDEEFPPPPAMGAPPAAPKSAYDLQRMRKRVNGMLQEGVDETITALAKHIRELYSARKVYKEAYTSMNTESRDYLNNLTIAAVKDARALLADTNKLMEAVIKYAYGTAELEKRAAVEAKMKKIAQPALDIREILDEIEEERGGFSAEPMDEDEEKEIDTDTPMSMVLDEEGELTESPDFELTENPDFDFLGLGDEGDEDDEGDENELDVEVEKLKEGPGGKLMMNISSKQERANARVKLAQKGLLGFNELSDQAHPGGSADAVSAANLDVKPSAPDAAFHVYKDLKDIMMELANMPPRVRKQAEMIQQLVSEGRMNPEQVDQLVSHNIDPDAVKYWKAMWGEAKDQQSTEFANKLTQEHSKAKQAEEMESYKGRVKRAYELANQMVAKGFINEAQVDAQVSDIMKYNNESFESMKKIIAKQPAINKQASIPAVGFMDSGALILPSAQPVERASGADIKGFFDNYFDNKGLKF